MIGRAAMLGTAALAMAACPLAAPLEPDTGDEETVAAELPAECLPGPVVHGAVDLAFYPERDLTLGAGGRIARSGEEDYVRGHLTRVVSARRATIRFPVGDGDGFRPVELTVRHSSAAPVAYTVAAVGSPAPDGDAVAPPLIRVSDVGHWRITACGEGVPETVHVNAAYGENDGVTAPHSLRLAASAGAGPWEPIGMADGRSCEEGGTLTSHRPVVNLSGTTYLALATTDADPGENPLD